MNALVVYDSQFGNTERIALAIIDALRRVGEAHAVRVNAAQPGELQGIDLLVVGCPTQGWRPTTALQAWLDGITAEQLRGVAVACFDTRFRKPRWLTGSAAGVMAKRLQRQGITLLVPPESFFVVGKEGPLYNGELERAATWTRLIVSTVEVPYPAMQ